MERIKPACSLLNKVGSQYTSPTQLTIHSYMA